MMMSVGVKGEGRCDAFCIFAPDDCFCRVAIVITCTNTSKTKTAPLKTKQKTKSCRILYEKWLETRPADAAAWLRFAELEAMLGEAARARALYELAVAQPLLDMPEALWKGYIDFEIGQVRVS